MEFAAELPPVRLKAPQNAALKNTLTPRQILERLGISTHRAAKALAATGNRSAQAALNFLVSHTNDPKLDLQEAREYTLIATPYGHALDRLEQFWKDSAELTGWNEAHESPPNITLVPFFKAPAEFETTVSKCFDEVVLKYVVSKKQLELRLAEIQQNEISCKVGPHDSEHLRNIIRDFAHGVRAVGVLELVDLRLTLAKNFNSNETSLLLNLLRQFKLENSNEWEMKLYSRDPCADGKQMFRVKQRYEALICDEISINIGDFICARGDDIESTEDGWAEGVNVSTGLSGFFPVNHVVRCSQSDSWTLHRCIVIYSPFGKLSSRDRSNIDIESLMPPTLPYNRSSSDENDQVASHSPIRRLKVWNPRVENLISPASDKQKLIIMRHGERVDFIFHRWTNHAFSNEGIYRRLDLNMPKSLPRRTDDKLVYPWRHDGPLTNIGLYQAHLTGEMLREDGVVFEHVFVSPAFRCVQTAHAVLKAMQLSDKVKLCIEPALLEFCPWYADIPRFFTNQELIDAGFNVDAAYMPLLDVDELQQRHLKESIPILYRRNDFVSQYVNAHIKEGNVLIVAHASNLETNSRILVDGKLHQLRNIVRQRLIFRTAVY